MKPGAKKSEQTQIYKLMYQGYDADQISRQLKIYKITVEKFMTSFKDSKKPLPQTSAFAEIKEGMPRLAGQGRVSGLQTMLANEQSANSALLARIEALEAKATPTPTQTVTPATDGEGEDEDGLG